MMKKVRIGKMMWKRRIDKSFFSATDAFMVATCYFLFIYFLVYFTRCLLIYNWFTFLLFLVCAFFLGERDRLNELPNNEWLLGILVFHVSCLLFRYKNLNIYNTYYYICILFYMMRGVNNKIQLHD